MRREATHTTRNPPRRPTEAHPRNNGHSGAQDRGLLRRNQEHIQQAAAGTRHHEHGQRNACAVRACRRCVDGPDDVVAHHVQLSLQLFPILGHKLAAMQRALALGARAVGYPALFLQLDRLPFGTVVRAGSGARSETWRAGMRGRPGGAYM